MEQKLTLRQVDCSPSKDGGLLVSLHLQPAGGLAPAETNGKRLRRRRRRKLTSEQVLELARTAINEAVESDASPEAARRARSGTRADAQRARAERSQRRVHWPG